MSDSGTVLALHAYDCAIWDVQFAGLLRYCQPRAWKVEALRLGAKTDFDVVRRRIRRGGVVGIITSLATKLPVDILSRLPVVCFDCPESAVVESCPHVRHDAIYTACLAARELLSLEYRHFAYVHASSGLYWTLQRGAAFEREILQRGGEIHPAFSAFGMFDRHRLIQALAHWLAELPKPCGVFAANDEFARYVVSACARAHLQVPEDIAVVGVDNDSRFQSPGIALTTVVPDWNAGAFFAAKTLNRLVRGETVKSDSMTFRPLGLIRRKSTRLDHLPRKEPLIREAVNLIREKACLGLRADEVLKRMRGSRRYAEMAFRSVTGMSVLEAIRQIRMENAKVLLENTHSSISFVAESSGYRSVTTFGRIFRDMTGMTPLAWRRKCANG